jgi:hypothetical protein
MGQEEPGKGLGVRWEGNLIYNRIYHDEPSGSRFIPVLLPGSELAHIPNPAQGHQFYRVAAFELADPGFEALYRHLTGQPATPRLDLGSLTVLPPRPRPQPVPGPLPPSGGPLIHVGGNVVGSAIGAGNTVTARDITVSIGGGDQADPELGRVLAEARRALQSGPLTGADKDDAADDLGKLAEEVSKPQPQPGRVRRLFESLKQLAPDVAAILASAAKIGELIKG